LSSKEKILNKIREALSNPVPLPFPASEGNNGFFKNSEQDDAVVFAEEFTKLQGRFSYCLNEEEFLQQLRALIQERNWQKLYCVEPAIIQMLQKINITPYNNLADCDLSITGCEYLVARTGSMVLSSAQLSGRTTSVYAPVHICIAYNSQLLYDIQDALEFMHAKYKENFPSFITFATGPSRTADIEKTLVTGVHGPKEVFCFLVEEKSTL
jgi:L-lactate dehydrogenase complex protein LldG